ncbi:hypothetical protein GCM10009133_37700 [Cocleimonas flava]|uniref:Nickel-dependent hydrogenase n=1 Tax=Cocleimonas flava TaxID=634765 RepID=A0A4R1F6Z7_9GAMM|nr:nickel-dependent hydrogenase large subunit [Cocleimonas flava]TCJ88392.1 nickel-dependent hydrogenase [Cocleimonas flava]
MTSIAGELNISISYTDTNIDSRIESSRPLHASKIFTGKSITHTLTTIPLLFNICAKAQTVTAVRAIESATEKPSYKQTESFREALITLENLREQSLRVVMDWPKYRNEQAEVECISHISLGIAKLMHALEPVKVLDYQGQPSPNYSFKTSVELWMIFSEKLSQTIFGSSANDWLENTYKKEQLDIWAGKEQSQAAKFIHWLNQKKWKHSGKSNITHIPDINDIEVRELLKTQGHEFTGHPKWDDQCYELSWFSRKQCQPHQDNGIYSRMIGRLKEIADLILKLDTFYIKGTQLESGKSSVSGIAHSEAARGRLTHFVEIENETIKKLVILAPTEWNFHPEGVAVKSLNNLDAKSPHELHQQAELLIHAIDPCVGFNLSIEG